jgi:DNA-3-methyladenine glycosylase I
MARRKVAVESAGAYFHIVGLKYHTTLLGPVLLEGEDQVLEGTHGWRRLAHEIHLFLGLRFKEREYTRFGCARPWSLMPRCFWCTEDPLYMAYHDQEWGTPLRDAQGLFELLLLEGFQAGLSWITVLRKRERYREVLYGFDAARGADERRRNRELMLDPGIIRNRLKLNAARRNAQAWLALEDPVEFLWSFVGGEPKINHFKDRSEVPAITPEALAMSKGLKKPASPSSARPFATP